MKTNTERFLRIMSLVVILGTLLTLAGEFMVENPIRGFLLVLSVGYLTHVEIKSTNWTKE